MNSTIDDRERIQYDEGEVISDDYMTSPHRKRKNLSMRKKDNLQEGTKIWTSFYRMNMHRLALDYLRLNLYPFQIIMLYMMNVMYSCCFICARGLSKSFCTAIFLVCKAILYPGSLIIVSCSTKEQSRTLIKEKIGKELMRMSPVLKKEILDIKTGTNETVVIFRNGSTIQAINASDNTRGMRCHVLVVDEYRMIKGEFETLNSILRPFLNCVRVPKFKGRKDGKYANYPAEENSEIYLSSAWYSDHFSYDLYMAHVKNMLNGKDYFTCNLPYQLSAYHGILTKRRVEDIRTNENMSDVSFMMEFEALFYKSNDNAYFKASDILPLRTLKYAWYPPTIEEYAEYKKKEKKPWHMKRVSDKELRVLSCDIALMDSKNGKNNDNAVFTFMKAIPKNENYEIHILYQEVIEGAKAKTLAQRIKELYYDAECDYIVLDVAGLGLTVLDELGEYTENDERGVQYPPLKAMNEDKYMERCGYVEAQKCIFCVYANKQFNHDIATTLKTAFHNKTIKMLGSQLEAEDYIDNYYTLPPEEQGRKLLPYINTSLMQDEIISLEYEVKEGLIKVYETGSRRKDRYSSLAYGNYFIREKEKKLKKKKKGGSISLW